MNEPITRCPVCHGAGECEAEKRRMRVDMVVWQERGCRACQATGCTTATRLAQYAINRRNDGKERQFFHERRKRREEQEAA